MAERNARWRGQGPDPGGGGGPFSGTRGVRVGFDHRGLGASVSGFDGADQGPRSQLFSRRTATGTFRTVEDSIPCGRVHDLLRTYYGRDARRLMSWIAASVSALDPGRCR
jgi:hypothetical protein